MTDLQNIATNLAQSFAKKASPKDMLAFFALVKSVREEERKAAQRSEALELNRQHIEHVMKLREQILDGVERRLAMQDQALGALLERLENASTPEEVAQTASAFAEIASTNAFKDAPALVAAIKAEKIDLRF